MPRQNGNGDAVEASESEEEMEVEGSGAAADDSYEPNKRKRVAPRQWEEGGSGREGKGGGQKGGGQKGKKGGLQVHGLVGEMSKAPNKGSSKPAKAAKAAKASKGAAKQQAGGAPVKKKKWCVRQRRRLSVDLAVCVLPVSLSRLAYDVRFRTRGLFSTHHGVWALCREETNDGFCAVCHEDNGDVHCKGGCRRSWHTACLPPKQPASSSAADALSPPPPPPSDSEGKSPNGKEKARPGRTRVRAVVQSVAEAEADDGDDGGWKCNQCATKTAECAACGETGARDSEVWKCRMGRCGLFYHADCARRLPLVCCALNHPQRPPHRNETSLTLCFQFSHRTDDPRAACTHWTRSYRPHTASPCLSPRTLRPTATNTHPSLSLAAPRAAVSCCCQEL